MGCFLGCFGFSSKRNRRKPANRLQPGGQRICSYEPLDSVSANLDVTEKPISLDSELKVDSKRSKEPFNCKIRKKVSFNLNVQTYEPIPKEDGSDEESKQEKSSTPTDMASYPSNYRYKNCIDSYDEEDEIAYEESDLDDEDEYDVEEEEDDYYDGDIGCLRRSLEEDLLSEKLESLSVNRDFLTESLNEEGMNIVGENSNFGDRIDSVLKPVENLSQWKAVKAKAMPPVKRQRKENAASIQQKQIPLISPKSTSKSTPLVLQEIAVDASLSNWLGSTEPRQLKSSNISVKHTSSFESREF